MRRLIPLILTCLLLFAFFACGDDGIPSSSSDSSPTPSTTDSTSANNQDSSGTSSSMTSSTEDSSSSDSDSSAVPEPEPEPEVPPHDCVFADEYTIDKQPGYSYDGERSRHCTYPGCPNRTDITLIPRLEPDLPWQPMS